MRLTAAGPRLDRLTAAFLDARLARNIERPVAVAFSGGGDSLALLLLAADWASRAGRPLLAITVDHGLNPASRDWTAACAARAEALGVRHQALVWTGEKPETGLPAAARQARHRLMADAARAAGAKVLLIGHTASDVIEARRMRAEGSSTPEPRPWTPSPVWPEGRGLFLARPLLTADRGAIRDWLEAMGERWIDDPANDDLQFARARARQAKGPAPAVDQPTDDKALAALAMAAQPLAGGLAINRRTLRAAPPREARRLIAAAALCAAGGSRPPTRERLRALSERLLGPDNVTATLAGARIEADREVRFLREAGEAARGGLAPLSIPSGETAVWDGRFEITADRGVHVSALSGHAKQLDDAQRRALMELPAGARPSLPWLDGASPMLGEMPGVSCRALAYERLLAACGTVTREL